MMGVEFTDRELAALHAENSGVVAQRVAAIRARWPRFGWRFEFDDGGVPVRARWGSFQ